MTRLDIFKIPVGDMLKVKADDYFIIYSPLADGLLFCSAEDKKKIENALDSGEVKDEEIRDAIEMLRYDFDPREYDIPDPDKRTRMSLMPNQICNFKCTYCYSAAGRSSNVIPLNRLHVVLDYFINEKRIAPQPISLFISGGGEPLINWDSIILPAVEYARDRAKKKKFTLAISLISNGSLITEEIAAELKRNNCSVCLSFEVLEDLQNDQRGSFDKVKKALQILHKSGVRTVINSTITPKSVTRIEEMVTTVAEEYGYVMQYTVEPVTSADLFDTPEDMSRFYDDFYVHYLNAKAIAKQRGVNLRFTFDDELRETMVRHCPGKFCVTAESTISICHLATSSKEERYENCCYGKITDEGVQIDREKFESLYRRNLFSYPECEACFAKWNCGGECMARRDTYPQEYMDEVCRFNRRFIRYALFERVKREVFDQTGLTIEKYIMQ